MRKSPTAPVPQFVLHLRRQVTDAADLRMAIDVQANRIALTLAADNALKEQSSVRSSKLMYGRARARTSAW